MVGEIYRRILHKICANHGDDAERNRGVEHHSEAMGVDMPDRVVGSSLNCRANVWELSIGSRGADVVSDSSRDE